MRIRRCRAGTCLECTPYTALLDLIGERLPLNWRVRLFGLLVRAGYTTPEKIDAASDDELLALRDLGEGNLTYLRDRIAGWRTPTGPPPPSAAERLAAQIEAELRRHLGGSALP